MCCKQAVIREPQNALLKADLIRVDAEIDGVDGAVSKAREVGRVRSGQQHL